MGDTTYIHGTAPAEQDRLAKLGELTNAAFIQFLELDGARSILDVGSGLGVLDRQLATANPQIEIWGVERSTAQLMQAASDLPNLRFVQGDAHVLPFDADRFDVVFCRYLLEHVADPTAVLREIRRVLKPGGKVFLQENNILATTFDPDCPTFDAVWRKFAELQAILGGDALVGKKLYRLLLDAGFDEITLSVQPEVHRFGMTTYRPWIENLIHNVRPVEGELVARGLATMKEVSGAIAELAGLIENRAGSAFFYWNRARAAKHA